MRRENQAMGCFAAGRHTISGATWVRGLIVLWLLVLPAYESVAQAPTVPKSGQPQLQDLFKKESPIHIASDRLEVSQKEGIIFFEGHVVAQQDDLIMTGRKLTVYAVQEKAKKAKGEAEKSGVVEQIDRIELEGDVTITQGDKLATAEKAVYFKLTQKIVLSGNPRVSRNKDVLQGQLITLYLQEERSVVEGAAQNPVQATIYPDGKVAK
jgi:lipopolysaccharide export system protein LptA